MRNPCTRDCPDRQPGCNCEKRKAWPFLREQIRQERLRSGEVGTFQRDSHIRIARRWKPRGKR